MASPLLHFSKASRERASEIKRLAAQRCGLFLDKVNEFSELYFGRTLRNGNDGASKTNE